MEWYFYPIGFITFWIFRALYFFIKFRHALKYKKIYDKYIKSNKDELSIARHVNSIRAIFLDAQLKDFIVQRIEPAPMNHAFSYSMKGFNNIHLLDEEIISKVLFKFEEAIGYFHQNMVNSINPIYWIEFFLKLPRYLISYLSISLPTSIMNLLQVIYWIAMILLGLHAAKVIDIKHWL